MSTSYHNTIYFFVIIVIVEAQFEGEPCVLDNINKPGTCILFNSCEYAKSLLKSFQKPQNCGFKGTIPIVCCPNDKGDKLSKSEKQCSKWYPKPLYSRRFIFRGTQSLAKEFPHMAVLGYGLKNDIQWLCGGSLISERFVLTAAHCLSSRDFGNVKWVRLGDLDIKNTTDDAKPEDFAIQQTFYPPDYKPSSYYNDIALIKLDRVVTFNDYISPACLYPNNTISEFLTITGWGKTDFLGETSSHLLKAVVNEIPYKDCVNRFKKEKKLIDGIVPKLQICAGHPEGKDTCPGDSGGPLQFKVPDPVHYYVVGITSFGKVCGVENSGGVYTRVAYFISWIENIVWS